ncbi:hypothetical protein CXK93_07075 [Stutzerimonas decontaminans]|uniref:Uncharacterized protein n=1 Tax=Stutzerimonas decontaminans TaxID=3022791 RepID=A0ABX4W4W6_9GAMM|nr:hypothetical protein [Stutzerimonas decontaminans]MCQ4246077.1 hypothetical protein [Stutzerimonas decontaminans]PNF86546.1 hypothetical protein CXK93_07075 [Stutzerimonas decontaminans]
MNWAKYIEYRLPNAVKTRLSLQWGKFEQQIVLPFTTVGLRLPKQETYDGVIRRALKNEESVRRAFQELCSAIEASNSSLVMVDLAGPGSTEKSRRVRFEAIYEEVAPGSCDFMEFIEVAKSHTYTVPASVLLEMNGHLYAPRWLLRKKLANVNKHNPPLRIAGSWDGQAQLWDDVFKPLFEEICRIQKIAEAEKVKRKNDCEDYLKRRELNCSQTAKATVVAPVGKTLAQKKKNSPKAKSQDADTILNVSSVEWDEWVEIKTKWGKQRQKKSFSAKDCSLRFSGRRIYIKLPDGRELIKLESNVRWQTISGVEDIITSDLKEQA